MVALEPGGTLLGATGCGDPVETARAAAAARIVSVHRPRRARGIVAGVKRVELAVGGGDVEAARGEQRSAEDLASGRIRPLKRPIRIQRMDEAIVAADVNRAVVGDDGRGAADRLASRVFPSFCTRGAVERVDLFVVAAEIDDALGIDRRGGGQRAARVEVPAHGPVGPQCQEAAVVIADVDRAIRADGRRSVNGGAERGPPLLRSLRSNRIECAFLGGTDVDGAVGSNHGRGICVARDGELPLQLTFGAQRIELVVVGLHIDGAVGCERGRGPHEIAGFVNPFTRAVRWIDSVDVPSAPTTSEPPIT
jgi:hypothetical protein